MNNAILQTAGKSERVSGIAKGCDCGASGLWSVNIMSISDVLL